MGRDKYARATEVASGTVAGTVGLGLAAEKLRDAYKTDYPAKFADHAAHAERAAGELAPKAGRLARVASHGRVGFVPLAIGTAAAATTTGAKRYRKRREAQAKPFGKAAPGRVAAEAEKAIPRSGHVKGIGRVRVLHYHANGHFMVLDRTDTKRLVHRDQIRFSKAAGEDTSAFGIGHIAKGQPALDLVGGLDDRVRRLKKKTLPTVPVMVARVGDKSRALVAAEQTKLDKAHDPDRSLRRRERGAEAALGAGSTAAAVGSVRAHDAGRAHRKTASTRAAQRDRAFTTSARDMAPHAEGLDRLAEARKTQRGKGVTSARLAHSATEAHNMRANLATGYARHHQALHSAGRAREAFGHARTLRMTAAGLGLGAYAAHRRAAGHDR